MGFLSSIVGGIGDIVTGNWGGLLDNFTGLFDDAAPYASAYAGYAGQQQANEMNLQISRENSAFNASEAQKNRDFQAEQIYGQQVYGQNTANQQRQYSTEMSNSSYQRAVQDMQAAGLNPMLAYHQGGASTPSVSAPTSGAASGATASAVSPSPMLNKAQAAMAGFTTAAQVKKIDADTQVARAQADNIRADTMIKAEQPAQVQADTGFKTASAQEAYARKEQILTELQQLLPHRIYELFYRGVLNQDTSILRQAERQLIGEQTMTQREKTRVEALTGKLLELDLPQAKSLAGMWSSPFGLKLPYLHEGERFISSATGAARDVAVGYRMSKPNPFTVNRPTTVNNKTYNYRK